MKYSILLTTLLATFSAQSAELVRAENNFIHGQYTFRDTVGGQSDETNRQGVNLTVGHKFTNNFSMDLGQQFRTEKLNSDNGENSNRLEAGATYSFALVPNVSVYTRGAIGYKFTEAQDFTYYSVEPGVNVNLTSALSARAGYRFRDSFSDTYFDKSNTVRAGVQYDLTKTSFVTAGIDRAYGDSEFIGYNFGYGVKF